MILVYYYFLSNRGNISIREEGAPGYAHETDQYHFFQTDTDILEVKLSL